MTGLAGQFLRHAAGNANREAVKRAITGTASYDTLYCGGCGADTRHELHRGAVWVTVKCATCGHSEDWRAEVTR